MKGGGEVVSSCRWRPLPQRELPPLLEEWWLRQLDAHSQVRESRKVAQHARGERGIVDGISVATQGGGRRKGEGREERGGRPMSEWRPLLGQRICRRSGGCQLEAHSHVVKRRKVAHHERGERVIPVNISVGSGYTGRKGREEGPRRGAAKKRVWCVCV